MVESSMFFTMLMETMVAPSWRLNMMGRLTTLSSMDMLGMVDTCRIHCIYRINIRKSIIFSCSSVCDY